MTSNSVGLSEVSDYIGSGNEIEEEIHQLLDLEYEGDISETSVDFERNT
jgi:hypothetical protein